MFDWGAVYWQIWYQSTHLRISLLREGVNAIYLKGLTKLLSVLQERINLEGVVMFYWSPRVSLSLMYECNVQWLLPSRCVCSNQYQITYVTYHGPPMDPMAHGVILHFLVIYGKCLDCYLEPPLFYLRCHHLVSELVLSQSGHKVGLCWKTIINMHAKRLFI